MKFGDYTKTLTGMLKENHLNRWLNLGLVFCVLVLSIVVMAKDKTVVMVPPQLLGEGSITNDAASATTKESWALSVALMLGNITPQTADYVGKNLGRLVAGRARNEVLNEINEQLRRMKQDRISIQFNPTTVFYVPSEGYTVVSGTYWIRGVRDEERQMVKTYEIGIGVRNYMISVTSLNSYEGAWKSSEAKAQAEAKKK